MKRILQKSFFKCIDSENQSGITFIEVLVIGVFVPYVVKNAKSYVINVDKHINHHEEFIA
jgi:hypothetical protein